MSSYSLRGHFVDMNSGNVILTADLDFMKPLTRYGRYNDFDEIRPSQKFDAEVPGVTSHVTVDPYAYYDPKVLEDPTVAKHLREIKEDRCTSAYDEYVIDESVLHSVEGSLSAYRVDTSEAVKSDSDVKPILISLRKTEESEGVWFVKEDFEKVVDTYRREYEEVRDNLDKLINMQFTADYYRLSEDQKSSLLSDIGDGKDEVEFRLSRYDAIRRITCILSFLSEDMLTRRTMDSGVVRDMWNFEDNRNIAVFIEKA